jgi:precorrin-3B synthase
LAAAIRDISQPFARYLGPKVTVIVDGAGQIGLAGLKADVRLVAIASDRWALSVADGEAVELHASEALSRVAAILQQLADLGPAARAMDLVQAQRQSGVRAASSPIGTFILSGGNARGIALPFGSATADAIVSLAQTAARMGITEFRLAPHHGMLAMDPSPAFPEQAAQLGFVTTASDPRTRISACIGSDGCASGHVQARAIAARLAPHLPANTHLHVSGCAKGCAHPRPADITLVGRADGYGLVIGGKAGDTPGALLQADQLESSLAAR